MNINGSLKFDASGLSQIENLRVEKLASLPEWGSADVGRLVYVTGTQVVHLGGASAWIALATGGNAAALQTEVDAIEVTLGTSINSDGTFNAAGFVGVPGGEPTSFTDAINKLAAYATGKDTLAELDDVTIATPTTGDALVYTSGGEWQNRAPGAPSGLQAHSDLLDGVTDLAAATGVVVKTGADTFLTRTLTGPAAGISVTNGDGVAGDPTIALANDLAALEGLATTGYVVRTGDGTATTRAITGTADNIVVTNGNGVTSDTSIDLAGVAQGNAGTFLKFTVDGFGRVTENTAVTTADITALVDATYVNVTGDTMSGNLVMSGATVTGLPSPSGDTDAVNKAYVDSLTAGLSWKNSTRVATQGNIDLASAASGYDGVTLTTGDRVLVKNQTLPEENGIYVFNGTGNALTRATDMDAPAEFDGSAVFVMEGNTSANTGWTETATVATVGTDPVSFSQFSGGSLYTWGVGLAESGNTVTINLGAGISELPTDEVGIDLYNATTGGVILTTDGTTRSTAAGAQLHLLTGGASGLAQSEDGLYIAPLGVTNAMLANDGVGLNADVGTSTLDLGQTLEIVGDSVQGVNTDVTGQTVTVSAADASSTQKGVASFSASHFAVTAGAVALDASLSDLNNVAAGVDGAATGSLLIKGATEWETVSTADFLGAAELDDLSDAAVSGAAAGDILVHNGTAFANRKIYFLYDGAASASHTVTHNLGQQYCNVTVVDDSDNVVIPQSIVFTSATALTVTFNTAIACKVVVMGV